MRKSNNSFENAFLYSTAFFIILTLALGWIGQYVALFIGPPGSLIGNVAQAYPTENLAEKLMYLFGLGLVILCMISPICGICLKVLHANRKKRFKTYF